VSPLVEPELREHSESKRSDSSKYDYLYNFHSHLWYQRRTTARAGPQQGATAAMVRDFAYSFPRRAQSQGSKDEITSGAKQSNH
jgi:hypothetical protein